MDNEFNEKNIYPKLSDLSPVIYINGNEDWQEFKNETDCTGNGTLTNPYIIRDLEINGQGSFSSCISIRNSDVYFQIENCTLYNATYGIYLYNVKNAYLNNNTCFNNDVGISLEDCNNNTISNCSMHDNRWGIYIDAAINITLQENSITNCLYGIDLLQSISCILIGNEMIRCGLYVLGLSIHQYPSYFCTDSKYFDHLIDIDNQVNGKLVYYYRNELNLNSKNFSNAGQVILYNCSNAIIEDLNLSFASDGMQLIASHYCTVYNITANNNNDCGLYILEGSNNNILNNIANDNNEIGISFESSNYNTILNNKASGNNEGIAFENNWLNNCDHNSLRYNTVENNIISGITLYYCNYNSIDSNMIINNKNGIHMSICHNTVITFNTINSNTENGIYLYKSDDNVIFNNAIGSNNIGIFLEYSENNEINQNIFSRNNQNIYIISENGNGPQFINFIPILMIIGLFIGLAGSLAAVTIYKIHSGRNESSNTLEKNQKEGHYNIKHHIQSSKEILSVMTNKDLLLQIFDPDKNQEMNALSEDIYLSSMSEKFLSKVDKLELNSSEKKEFLKEMFTFSPIERNDIVDDILRKFNTLKQ